MKKNNKILRLIHRGSGGQQGWIYSIEGLMSTIPASTYKDPPKILIDVVKRDNNENNSIREYKERNIEV